MVRSPGGGGKREVSSYEHYDRELGISVWRSPSVKGDEVFFYYDPIEQLPAGAGREFWKAPGSLDRRLAEWKSRFGAS